jgi:hypothetical protein
LTLTTVTGVAACLAALVRVLVDALLAEGIFIRLIFILLQ